MNDKITRFHAAKKALAEGADVRDVVLVATGGEPITAPLLAALDELDVEDIQAKLDAGLRACYAYDGMKETAWWQLESGEVVPVCCAGLSPTDNSGFNTEAFENFRFVGWGRWHHGSASIDRGFMR